ncbi:hypothetical protein V6N13_050204 [Hibiscus sabdariffa]|uniref:RNase H type-1 domain-containing protein n=1 Tax=Hibiscus sabdariffa TaxID=183260 RepID=A0ABR2QV48_9ROSI
MWFLALTFCSLNAKHKIVLMVTFWTTWYARSKVIHEGVVPSVCDTLSFVEAFIRENDTIKAPGLLRNSVDRISWQAPMENVIKLNFDAAYDAQSNKSFSGVICRDNAGFIMAACTSPHSHLADAFLAEVLACLQAVNFPRVPSDPFADISFCFTHREANSAAHALAREGKLFNCPMFWIEEAPPNVTLAAEIDRVKLDNVQQFVGGTTCGLLPLHFVSRSYFLYLHIRCLPSLLVLIVACG